MSQGSSLAAMKKSILDREIQKGGRYRYLEARRAYNQMLRSYLTALRGGGGEQYQIILISPPSDDNSIPSYTYVKYCQESANLIRDKPGPDNQTIIEEVRNFITSETLNTSHMTREVEQFITDFKEPTQKAKLYDIAAVLCFALLLGYNRWYDNSSTAQKWRDDFLKYFQNKRKARPTAFCADVKQIVCPGSRCNLTLQPWPMDERGNKLNPEFLGPLIHNKEEKAEKDSRHNIITIKDTKYFLATPNVAISTGASPTLHYIVWPSGTPTFNTNIKLAQTGFLTLEFQIQVVEVKQGLLWGTNTKTKTKIEQKTYRCWTHNYEPGSFSVILEPEKLEPKKLNTVPVPYQFYYHPLICFTTTKILDRGSVNILTPGSVTFDLKHPRPETHNISRTIKIVSFSPDDI